MTDTTEAKRVLMEHGMTFKCAECGKAVTATEYHPLEACREWQQAEAKDG